MKTYRLFTFLALAATLLVACEPKPEPTPSPETEQEVLPASFPRKHLIEEFTSQYCGYCPMGMDGIHSFMGTDTNFVLILHHYGYQADHFSVKGSLAITNKLRVNGAPSACIDRAKTKYTGGNTVILNPASDMAKVNKSQFVDTTYASINIKNTYNAETRELRVNVSGVVCTDDHPDLKLTVLVKESGMIDFQADYQKTTDGWKEFRHTNAVRAYLSDSPLGDSVFVNNHRYEDVFAVDIKEKWNADNCMVVAFLSEDFQPIVQVAQKPVVEGTQGGADILHEGITKY